jgi:PIN domain nuclease of toxin-antitoxin system
MLNVTPRHAASLDSLPPLHGDPFDRMLIAQALSEPLRLLTADRALGAYGAMVISEI